MSVFPVVNTFIKKWDIYKRKITSAISFIKANEDLVKYSFLAQGVLVKNWLLPVTHLNEQIIDAFIENEADPELVDKEHEEEVLFNLRILSLRGESG